MAFRRIHRVTMTYSWYHIYASCFSVMASEKCLLSWHQFLSKTVTKYGHFLKPTDSILFESRHKPSSLNFTQYAVLPRNIEIALWPQIAVTSLHPMYELWFHVVDDMQCNTLHVRIFAREIRPHQRHSRWRHQRIAASIMTTMLGTPLSM